ncbi:MAG TPA: prolipoprotein diacylglyceryl transferase family protein [Myxococcota bacterium]|nr:prolipoprotein diacylglyceryl transferase family protein [Myxococcota bacterium]
MSELPVTWLGLGIFGGGLAGACWLARALPRVGIEAGYAWRVFPYALFGGCLGAKVWAAVETLFEPGGVEFGAVLWSRAGATFYGGLALGALAVVARTWLDGVSLRSLSTAIAPSLALGQAIGRIGCFLVGDDYGVPTDLPWGVAFPNGAPPTTERVHPAQLYEAAWLFGCALLLRRRLGRSRLLIGEYLVLQGAGRFAIELVRTNPPTLGFLTTSQVIALVCLAAGGIGLAAAAESPEAGRIRTGLW